MIDYNVTKEEYNFIEQHYRVVNNVLISVSTGNPISIVSSSDDGDKVRIITSKDTRRRVYLDAIKSLLHYGADIEIKKSTVHAILEKFKSVESASRARNDSRISLRLSIKGKRERIPYHVVIAILKAAEVPLFKKEAKSTNNEIFKREKSTEYSPLNKRRLSPHQKVMNRIHSKKENENMSLHTDNVIKSELSVSMNAVYHGPVVDIGTFNKMYDEVSEVVKETVAMNNGNFDSVNPDFLSKHLVNDIRPEIELLLASWVRIVVVGLRSEKIYSIK